MSEFGGGGPKVSANRRREPNLYRPGRHALSAAETWRCGNDACRAWVKPSKAVKPRTCHECGTPRGAK